MSDIESAHTLSEPGALGPADSIPLCVPALRGNERAYVDEALQTNWISSVGPFVDRFEREAAAHVGATHGVATTSGTAALHVGLLLARVEPGDAVLVSTLAFVAPANAVRYVGAHPIFVDAEPDYWQLDADKLAHFLAHECRLGSGGLIDRTTGRRVRAILPVHILGHPVDLDPVLELAARYGLAVVEDAAESFGARYRSSEVGAYGGLGCLSFNGNKLVTAGGGGMIVTNDESLARRARYLTTQAKDDPIGYVHREIGFNYRLSNVQAAIGCAQLEQVDSLVAAKRRVAARYADAFAPIRGLEFMREASWATSACWLSTLLVDPDVHEGGRERLRLALLLNGIQSRPLWQPLHLSPAHAGARATDCREAERIGGRGLSLPSSVSLSSCDQQHVIDAVLKELER